MDGAMGGNIPEPKKSATAGRLRSVDAPSLPYGKAFMVQFSSVTDPSLEHATGRLEHLQSGRRAPFASAAELLACIGVMLTDSDAARPPSMTEGRGQLSGASLEEPS
jgi:hypothetical protein